jgi:hypothetical protein
MTLFSKKAQLARSPKTQREKREGNAQQMVNSYMSFVRSHPCFISGSYDDVECCHVFLVTRQGLATTPRTQRPLDRTHTSHKGVHGLYCIPLTKELHREQHRIGLQAFFSKYEFSMAEVYSYISEMLANYFYEEEAK